MNPDARGEDRECCDAARTVLGAPLHYLVGPHLYARQPENESAHPVHPAVARVLLAAEQVAMTRGGAVQAEADALREYIDAAVQLHAARRTFEAPHGC